MAKRSNAPKGRRKKKAAYPRDPHEWYVDEPYCTELLLDRHAFPGPILDPCAGRGTIGAVARAKGYVTIETDLIERGFPTVEGGHDFLGAQPTLYSRMARTVMMNPPFGAGKLARAFIRQALAMPEVQVVAALLPQKLLFGRATHELYTAFRPNYFHPLVPRPSMPPGALLVKNLIKQEDGKVDFFWAVWDRRVPMAPHAWPSLEPLIGPPRGKGKSR